MALMVIIAVISIKAINNLKTENNRLLANQEVLMSENSAFSQENRKYKVSDSLNAAKVAQLQLTLDEYKRFRASDLKLIEKLKVDKSDLSKIISSKTETVNSLTAKLESMMVKDTVTNRIDTLKCFNYKSIWTDISGCLNLSNDSIELNITNRESLKIVESVKYKRFLGFLWKTNKIKSKNVDVISLNPNTKIENVEYINVSD